MTSYVTIARYKHKIMFRSHNFNFFCSQNCLHLTILCFCHWIKMVILLKKLLFFSFTTILTFFLWIESLHLTNFVSLYLAINVFLTEHQNKKSIAIFIFLSSHYRFFPLNCEFKSWHFELIPWNLSLFGFLFYYLTILIFFSSKLNVYTSEFSHFVKGYKN